MYEHMCMHIYVYIHIHICICMCVCAHTYTHTHTHISKPMMRSPPTAACLTRTKGSFRKHTGTYVSICQHTSA